MKKSEKLASHRRNIWLRKKQERKRRRLNIQEDIKRQYQYLKERGLSPDTSRRIIARTLSRQNLDHMEGFLEGMFSQRGRFVIKFRS